jgi:RHS repeat-associated protein
VSLTQSTALITTTLAGQIASRQVLRYASYAYDAESGLYYCSARYYAPATRQFTTADPAKADGEQSAYQYCAGDPVGNVDPTGQNRWRTFACLQNGAGVRMYGYFYFHLVYGLGGDTSSALAVFDFVAAIQKPKSSGQDVTLCARAKFNFVWCGLFTVHFTGVKASQSKTAGVEGATGINAYGKSSGWQDIMHNMEQY